MIFVGDDWAEDHHDVWVMNPEGRQLAAEQIPEGPAGIARMHSLLATYADEPEQVVVGIETEHGLWVEALAAAGYQVYAINPLSASRYRDRHRLSGAKSDPGDAKVLADLVRTDRHNHRQLAGDSLAVDAIKIRARSHQTLIWARVRHTNMLRAALVQYYPLALAAFDDLYGRDALAVLAIAPTPAQGARLSVSRISAALKKAGRQRYLDARAREIQTALRGEQLNAPNPITTALAASARSQVAILAELTHQIQLLEDELTEHFEAHPDADIYLSLPGLGVILGARVLGEFGDDPNKYTSAKSRKNYAATSPITVASGKKRAVLARHVKNNRLYDALDRWAIATLRSSPGARAYYDQHTKANNSHTQAIRALANRLVGILHGCLRHHTTYDEHTAWAHRTPAAA